MATSCRRARAGPPDPYGARSARRLHVRPRRGGVEVGLRDVCVRAARAARCGGRAARRFDGTVELHFTYDEEVGGAIGPAWLLQQKISAPDYAISAGFSYGITTAHNGCLHLQVEVAGKSGHAAEPEKGIDALEAATGILADLYALRKSYWRAASRRCRASDRRRSSSDSSTAASTPTSCRTTSRFASIAGSSRKRIPPTSKPR